MTVDGMGKSALCNPAHICNHAHHASFLEVLISRSLLRGDSFADTHKCQAQPYGDRIPRARIIPRDTGGGRHQPYLLRRRSVPPGMSDDGIGKLIRGWHRQCCPLRSGRVLLLLVAVGLESLFVLVLADLLFSLLYDAAHY